MSNALSKEMRKKGNLKKFTPPCIDTNYKIPSFFTAPHPTSSKTNNATAKQSKNKPEP